MRKIKLLFTTAVLLLAGGISASAQTDVTSTYLANASFEENAATVAETKDANAVTGWTFAYSKNDKVVVSVWDDTNNATGYGKQVTPADLAYYTQVRVRWEDGINSGTLKQQTAELPAGLYQLSIKYKAASSNNTNGTAISLTVKNGSSTLSSVTGEVLLSQVRDNSLTLFDDEHPWKTMTTTFYLPSATAVNVEATFAANQNSDAIFDDVRLLSYSGWTDAGLSAGTYLFKNVASDRYLGPANSWGTQASLLPNTHSNVLALNEGYYTIESQVDQGGKHFFSGTYMDGSSTNIAILKNSSDKIIMVSPSGIAGYDGTSNIVAQLTDPSNANAYWNLISVNDAKTGATKAAPIDLTFLIKDANFDRNSRNFSSWTRSDGTADNTGKGGDNENLNWQKWNGKIDFNQTVSDLPNGLYKLKAQGFYRPGANNTASTDQNAIFYAGSASEPIALVSSPHIVEKTGGFDTDNTNETTTYKVPNSQSSASKCFTAGYYENIVDNIHVTEGSLKFGVKNEATVSNQWIVIDNFRLYYYGPTIASSAIALPSTTMAENTWYYFDINIDGDYDLTLTSLSDIVYTTDGSILREDEGDVTANFAKADELALAAGRYYVKSASAQVLAVNPHAYSYEVGTAALSAADGSYTQSSSFTVTFPDAVSSDPGASATLIASAKATVNGSEIALAAVTNGFSVNLGTLTPSTDYVIAIPANVYGYEGQSMNNAIEVTVHTPAVFDGEYCLYDATNKLFLGRGCAYGTEAAADKYGIPFNLVTDATGKSAIEFVDWTGVYLFSTNSGNAAGMYTDNASTGWKFVSVTGGFYLKDFNGEFYAKVDNGGYGYYVHTIAGTANATIWTLKTKAERDAIIASYPAENISNVIAAAGITTTPAEFLTYMSSNYNAVDATANIGTATFAGAVGDWTWSQIRGQEGQPAYGTNFVELWNATGSYSQTIGKTNLPAGIYKVTVQGYERRKDNSAATALYAAGYNNVSTYLSANGEQVRFTDWNEVDGKPTNTGDAVTAFNKGEATNVVYIYLDGNTDLTLTVKKPCYIWDNWAILNNFTLTRYELKSENITVSAAGFATYASDNDLDFSGVTGLTAYKATVSGTSINFSKVTTVPAGEGVLIKADAGNYSIPVTTGVAAWAADDNAFVRGTGAAVASNDGNVYNYVLSKHNEEVGFYPASGKTVGSDKAYISTTIDAARLTIAFDDETTGISSALMNSEKVNGVYNLNGQRVNKAQKGLYIINGKKVIK